MLANEKRFQHTKECDSHSDIVYKSYKGAKKLDRCSKLISSIDVHVDFVDAHKSNNSRFR